MRLLHTTQLTFKEFFDDSIPPYCILSHRWGDDEVSYNDFLAGRNKTGTGYAKIVAACSYAFRVGDRSLQHSSLKDSYEWIWIDTCCIDKSSSAELTEAINSMYAWYSDAEICFAYLHDVPSSNDREEILTSFRRSNWHTRGWTLQELLAPDQVCFLDQTWRSFGTKQSLADTISKVTKISSRHLSVDRSISTFNPSLIPVAEKMSWAAQRQTSRREDQAYCLLGLLDINIPLLYGEGSKAFHRLQLELLKSSDDKSIFVWAMTGSPINGVLAPKPASFGMLPKYIANSFVQWNTETPRHAYTVTNKGLEIHVPWHLAREDCFLLPLNCIHYSGELYAIALRRIGRYWCRVMVDSLEGLEYHSTAGPGLFVVKHTKLWNRETLRASGSEVIDVWLGR